MKKFTMVIVALIYSFLSVNLLFAEMNLYGSFTGAGIWKWGGTTWSQVTPNTPTAIAASGSTLYGNFSPGGIWKWDGTTWSQVTPNVATAMAVSGSVLYGNFEGAGIWKWDGTTWTQVTPNNPQSMAATGSLLYGNFGTGAGIWKWDGTTWTQITPNSPTDMMAGSSVLYGNFGTGAGIWKWDGSTWSQVTPNSPTIMAAFSEGLPLCGSFAGGGIWQWDGSTWGQITPNNPASMVYAAAGPAPVNLGTAGNFVILAKTEITTTGTTHITGDIGVSPAAATYIRGFDLIADSTNTFSTSSLVTGKVYAANYADPTPANMTTAVSDMETAYTDAAGRTLPDYTELYAGDVSGRTLVHGLYKWGTGVLITNVGVTLSGGENDVWIFQIAGDLTVDSTAIVTLSGGAQAKNIFWQVAGQATLGTTSQFKGIILCKTLIAAQNGATLTGRALAQTAVTLDANAITAP
jgi:hypothetical protein